MSVFNRVAAMIKSNKTDYGHIHKNRKNIQTLKTAKEEIEKALTLKGVTIDTSR